MFGLSIHLDRQYSFRKNSQKAWNIDQIKKGDGPNGMVSDPDHIVSLKLK